MSLVFHTFINLCLIQISQSLVIIEFFNKLKSVRSQIPLGILPLENEIKTKPVNHNVDTYVPQLPARNAVSYKFYKFKL